MSHSVHFTGFIKLFCWVATLPFYIYALIKWHQFNEHFLIQKRFPSLSYTMFAIAYLGQTLSWIADLMVYCRIPQETVDITITYFIFSCTFAISGLVLYRINLVYLKWRSLQGIKPALVMASSGSASPSPTAGDTAASTTPIRTVYQSTIAILISLFICIGSVLCYLFYIFWFPYYLSIQFVILWILIAVSIFNIKRNNVKEELGCIKECYAMLISLLLQMILQVVIPYDHKHHSNVLQYSTFFVLNVQGLVTLYIPLLLLLKYEGTLHLQQYLHKTDGKVFVDSNIVTSHNTNWDVDAITVQDPTHDAQHLFINKCLFRFLYQNESNHRVFSDYLRLCFAIESLLFVERVSIFYHMILKLKQTDQLSVCDNNTRSDAKTDSHTFTLSVDHLEVRYSISSVRVSRSDRDSFIVTAADLDMSRHSRLSRMSAMGAPDIQISTNATCGPTLTPITSSCEAHGAEFAIIHDKQENVGSGALKYIYRFEFAYLTHICKRYQRIIDARNAEDGNCDITVYRKTLYGICTELYNQFIAADAASQVNLSADVCKPLHRLLGGDKDDVPNEFQSYDDFLTVFDGAVIEAYRLMVNVYCYRFKHYVTTRYGDSVEFE